MRLFLTALLLPLAVCADPITMTVSNQTTQTSVYATAGWNTCMKSDPVSSSCLVKGSVPMEGASASASVTGLTFAAQAGAGNVGSSASASASFTETIQINGGTGTGYLNIGAELSVTNPEGASFSMLIGGRPVYFTPQIYPAGFAVIPFDFGEPLSISMLAGAGVNVQDNFGTVTASVPGARIYTHMPTGCNISPYQPCSDPTFTPADILTGHTVPEPSTLLLAGLGVFGLAVVRRRRRGQ